jgi:hypothetical protein
MYLATTSQVAFSTAGVQRMIISNSNVGVGTSNPRLLMTVKGTASGEMAIEANAETGNAVLYLGTPSNASSALKAAIIAEGVNSWSRSKLHFCLDNTTSHTYPTANASIANSRMTILCNGFVGIGTTAPVNTLDISGSARIISNVGIGTTPTQSPLDVSGPIIVHRGTRGGGGYANFFLNVFNDNSFNTMGLGLGCTDAGTSTIRSQTAGSRLTLGAGNNTDNTLTISNSRVGIGITAPTELLYVNGGGVAVNANASAGGTTHYQWHSSNSYRWAVGLQPAETGSANGGANLQFFSYADNGAYLSNPMTITRVGRVGIGTNSPSNGQLHVDTSLSVTIPSGEQLTDTDNSNFTGGTCNVSIYSRGFIWANQPVVVTSDQRIKTDIIDISDGQALDTIRLIEPKRYKYIETAERTDEYVYGFLAQQVSNVLPYSTTLKTRPVPDIYDIADICGTRLTLRNKDVSGGDANVHYITDDFKEKRYWTRFVNSRTLDVSMDVSDSFPGDKVYVYGRVVDDFHVLDKNAIYTVGIAALQEVDRQVQRQQATIEQLTSQLADLTARLTQLEANNGT